MINSRKIEGRAIRVVEDTIEQCPRLSCYLNQNDKTPTWDGAIYLYKDESERSDALKGRISVQVKGKTVSGTIKPPFEYSIRTSDLRNFLYDGGCLFFVVVFSTDGNYKIYYKALHVVTIQNLLGSIQSNQKSCSVKFKSLPDDTNLIISIFENFFADSIKQRSFANQKLLHLEEAQNLPTFINYTISTISCGEKPTNIPDTLKSIEGHDIFLYANLCGSPIPVPLSDEIDHLAINSTINLPICIDGIEYYNTGLLTQDASSVTVSFGDGFIIYLSDSEIKLTCKSPKFLDDRIKALRFITQLMKINRFSIGEHSYDVPNFKIDLDAVEIERQVDLLVRLQSMLRIMHVSEPCNVDLITEAHWTSFFIVEKAIIKKEVITNLCIGGNRASRCLCNIAIGNIGLLCLVDDVESDPNAFSITDAFNDDRYIMGLERTDNTFEIATLYAVLDENQFCEYSNIDYTKITKEFQQAFISNPNAPTLANDTLNIMLIAYDKKPNPLFLQAINELCEWLITIPIQNVSDVSKQIDQVQIAIRMGDNWQKYSDILYPIIDNKVEADDIHRLSAYTLINDYFNAKRLFETLSDNEQSVFKSLPIYHFYENLQ